MSIHAQGTFTVSAWEESTAQELDPPAKLTRATITQEFSGDLTATGTAESLMAYAADGTAVFVGFQYFTGELHGRRGSFVLRADGGYDGTEARTVWSVVEGSGTDGLIGLRGEGSAVVSSPPGSFSFDYDLG
jgi:hypothetical protein